MRSNIFLMYLAIGGLALSLSTSASVDGQLSCLLEPSERIKLSSPVSGVVKKVNTERGNTVKKNDVLFTLNDGVERASLETSKAKMEFAKRKLERNQTMFEKNMLSDFALDELETEYEISKLLLREVKERLELREIKSPISGIVVSRDVSPGEFVSDQPALELVALDPLHAEVVMQAEKYGFVSEGMELNVEVLASRDVVMPGVVKIVDRVIDGASGTFGVRVEIANPDNRVPAGLKCNVILGPKVASQSP